MDRENFYTAIVLAFAGLMVWGLFVAYDREHGEPCND